MDIIGRNNRLITSRAKGLTSENPLVVDLLFCTQD